MNERLSKEEAQVVSPLTGEEARVLKKIDVDTIVKEWKKCFNYDVGSLFTGRKELLLCECLTTAYKFYYPAVEGDSRLYEHLQRYPWYYMPWKWEHDVALGYIEDGMKVLEIGCGRGGFLSGILDRRKVDATGLELNVAAAQACGEKGLDAVVEDVKAHALSHAGEYDVVCAFQVLEHIFEVRLFLDDVIKCLKPGGVLLISVPNDESIFGDLFSVLNAPPHHVGLWNKTALRALEALWAVELKTIEYEPLQRYHAGGVAGLVEQKLTKGRRIMKMAYRLSGYHRIINKAVECLSKWLTGHSVVAIYTLKER